MSKIWVKLKQSYIFGGGWIILTFFNFKSDTVYITMSYTVNSLELTLLLKLQAEIFGLFYGLMQVDFCQYNIKNLKTCDRVCWLENL